MANYRRVAQLRTADKFREYQAELGIRLPFDEEMEAGPESPMAQPYRLKDGFVIGNRWAVHPMEGWDGTPDGKPSDLTIRRWRNFGESGAKLIWGGEAVAVRHDGRANPNQVMINEENLPAIREMREQTVAAHEALYGTSDDLLFGLQLTHSGRFSRPNQKSKLEPMILYHHPLLAQRFGLPDDYPLMTDADIEKLIGDFVNAAEMAEAAGFDFVDIKHCHGYLGHEFLSAYKREGKYGGSFENRTRFLREIVAGIRERVPGLRLGVRVSSFDWVPFAEGPESREGRPVVDGYYPYAFGSEKENYQERLVVETVQFLELLLELGIELANISCGSPYYVPHIQRPALFPPSDGYQPPEDPLVGVARQINNVADLKRRVPELAMVGTGYSYLQEWLPNVAQYHVREGLVDFVGLGRMMLSYPTMPADTQTGNKLARKQICRTFSDCTTAPRAGLVSGCYPLDDFYKNREEADILAEIKKNLDEQ